ncbi:MAG: sodium-dependent transporter [Methanocorpusculum sp.]|nr:sodium-dependent transporter [Methanocorpusculum sp.]
MNDSEERGSFSGKLGFILTAAGAAIGLGCIWRFPYLTAQYGGGIFILIYLLLLATLGITLLMTEIAIGRKTGTGVLGAFAKLNKKFTFLGYLCLLVPLLIQPYYSVLGAWITKYAVTFATGGGAETASAGYYTSFIASTEPVIWVIIFVIATGLVVLLGVRNGVERACKILMPIEVILLIILAVYCLTLPGSLDGLYYYLYPDISNVSAEGILAALGQVFYSLSLGFGIMLTFGSYLSKKVNLTASSVTTGFFTLLVAFIAGSLIIPASYIVTNGNPIALSSGSMFESLPMVFTNMPLGLLMGAAFFILLTFAALTSNICALEVMVAALRDKFGVSRLKGVILMTLYTLAFSIPIALGYGVLSFIDFNGMKLLEIFDFTSGTILLPIVALCTCILVGYFIKSEVILDEIKLFSRFKGDKKYMFMIKYFIPLCIIIIFVYGIVSMF